MLKSLPTNPVRGLLGLSGMIMMFGGAAALWGFAAAFLILGIFVAVDCSADEAVERFTMTKRDISI